MLSFSKKKKKWLMYFKVCLFKSDALYFSLKKDCREKKNPVSLHICRRNFISMASIQSHADKGSPLPHKIVIFIMHTVKLLKAKSSKFSNLTSIWNKMMWNTVMVAMDLKLEKKHFLYILGPMLCIQAIFFSDNFELLIFHRISYGYLHFPSVKINYLLAISVICYLWV